MKNASLIPLLILSLLTLTCLIFAPIYARSGVHFYILGTEGCPHCKHLKEALTKAYGPGAVTFLEVTHEENAQKLISLYRAIYPEAEGVGIPLTVVVVNNVPIACAVGNLPPDVWQRLIEEARRAGRFVKMSLNGEMVMLDEDARQNVAAILELGATGASRDPPQQGGEPIIIALAITMAVIISVVLVGVYLHSSRKRLHDTASSKSPQ